MSWRMRVWPGAPALVALAMLAAAPVGAAPGAGGEPCPVSTIDLHGFHLATSAVRADTVQVTSVWSFEGFFDLARDTLGAFASDSAQECLPGDPRRADVVSRESYMLVGPAPGTPVSFTIRVPVAADYHVYPGVPQGEMSLGGSVTVNGAVRDSFALQDWCCHGTIPETLRVDDTEPAGTWFEIDTRLVDEVCYYAAVRARGGVRVTGLHAGVAMVSCHGDTVARPTAVPPALASALRLTGVRPNPSRGDLTVSFTAPPGAPMRLQIIDAAGRIVRSTGVAAGAGEYPLRGGPPLAAGSYVVRLVQGGRSASRRFSVVR